jgi:hypothetical protein
MRGSPEPVRQNMRPRRVSSISDLASAARDRVIFWQRDTSLTLWLPGPPQYPVAILASRAVSSGGVFPRHTMCMSGRSSIKSQP